MDNGTVNIDGLDLVAGVAEGLKQSGQQSGVPGFYSQVFLGSQLSGIAIGGYNLWHGRRHAKALRDDTSDSDFNEAKHEMDVKSMRESYEDSLRFQVDMLRRQYRYLCEQDNFRFYCERFWAPQFRMTVLSIRNMIDEMEAQLRESGQVRVQLLIAWTPALQNLLSLNGMNAKEGYSEFCGEIKSRLKGKGVFSTSFINGWSRCGRGTVADTMMLYQLMRGIPTVVLFLTEHYGVVGVEVAKWGLSGGTNEWTTCRMFETVLPEDGKEKYIADMLYCSAAITGDGLRRALFDTPFQLEDTLEDQVSSEALVSMAKAQYSDIEVALIETRL